MTCAPSIPTVRTRNVWVYGAEPVVPDRAESVLQGVGVGHHKPAGLHEFALLGDGQERLEVCAAHVAAAGESKNQPLRAEGLAMLAPILGPVAPVARHDWVST